MHHPANDRYWPKAATRSFKLSVSYIGENRRSDLIYQCLFPTHSGPPDFKIQQRLSAHCGHTIFL
jgi:hypothetical protein